MEFSKLVLIGLFRDQQYAKKVIPYIKKEFFTSYDEAYVFTQFKKYLVKHRSFPSQTSFKIEIADARDVNENTFEQVNKLLDNIFDSKDEFEHEWLVTKTEEWCKERAIYNALLKSIELHEERKDLDGIPEILRGALQISFDDDCGIDFFDEKCMSERMRTYRQKIKKFSTGIHKLDMITDGGFESKAVSIFFGASGSGKTATLVAVSANMCRNGEDVLYITLEMAESKISQRYEANFLDTTINSVKDIQEDSFKKRLLDIKGKKVGRLTVKEYPTATINTEHIRALLDELEIKKNFKPTVLVVDYINLMRSSRFSGDNMYSTLKCIIEELRGLAIEKELCLITATQANREGNSSNVSDLDMTNVGESKAIVDTCDFLAALIYPEELREKQLQIWKVLKNRFGGTVNYKMPVKTYHEKSKVTDVEDDDLGLETQQPIPTSFNEPKPKPNKQEVNMKFTEENLDDDLWDD